MKMKAMISAAAILLANSGISVHAADLISHPVPLDAEGKLVAWAPFGRVLGLGWEALERVPVQANGLRTYFTYSRFSGEADHFFEGIWWAHNPAGLTAMLVSGASAYYAYSGDSKQLGQVRESVDYHLVHGTTPASWD